MDWIYIVDLFGTTVFSISGVLTAKQKKFDLVGTLVIGFVTAVGGGTIRDLLIGKFPVGWLNDHNYLFAILAGYLIAYIFQSNITKLKRSMFLFDTIGIGLFTILGIEIAMERGLGIEYCLLLGVISACFGGISRDVLTNEIPLIFRREIYASACFVGGIVYVILMKTSVYKDINVLVSIIIVILIRYLSIRNKWTLNFNKDE